MFNQGNLMISLFFSEKQILNRNVILVHHDDKGFIFVTERNSRKYKDFVSIISH